MTPRRVGLLLWLAVAVVAAVLIGRWMHDGPCRGLRAERDRAAEMVEMEPADSPMQAYWSTVYGELNRQMMARGC
jgi:hypothetical protein